MVAALVRTARVIPIDTDLAAALAQASAALARLDQALIGHPLLGAYLHRVRLEAVRRQAAVDGQLIDPWHLAAVLEGLRLRMDPALRIIDRGAIFEAARAALTLHQWLTGPDCDQEGAVKRATANLAAASGAEAPLLTAAFWLHTWLGNGGARPPARAALVRFWGEHRLLRPPVPLTGAAALRAGVLFDRETWPTAFLTALADEAADALQLLIELERVWVAARRTVASGRRRHSRAAAALDLLAAAPLISPTTLATALGMAVKNAAALLADFAQAGIAVEVTHRSKRRLFGLAGLAPLRDAVAPPRRPDPERGRGRPAVLWEGPIAPPPDLPPLSPIERQEFDYTGLEAAVAQLDQKVRQTHRALGALASQRHQDPMTARHMSVADPLAAKFSRAT